MDLKQKIEEANQAAVKRMIEGDPVLVDIAPAIEVVAAGGWDAGPGSAGGGGFVGDDPIEGEFG